MTEARPTSPPADPSPAAEALRLATAYQASRALYVAAKLGLPDLLADGGPRSADDLAAATGAHAPSLRRLLRALAAFGVFAEGTDGNFALGPLGGCLPGRGVDDLSDGGALRSAEQVEHLLLLGALAWLARRRRIACLADWPGRQSRPEGRDRVLQAGSVLRSVPGAQECGGAASQDLRCPSRLEGFLTRFALSAREAKWI